MQFGLFTLFDFFPDRQNEITYYKDTLDLLIYAEQLGFDSAWVGEEHFYAFGICPSPQLFLTALARETNRLRLGTAISIMALENLLRKAEDFAMLDILSGGRFNFGVGRGGYPKHFAGFRKSWERLLSFSEHVEERALVGTPRDCRQRIAELREEFGIEHLAFYFHAGARKISHARRGIELFAREVMPEFR